MVRKQKSPNPVDVHVGRRIRIRRVMREVSQTKLAEQLGLTFQQLQKYESGANRVSASRLWHIAQILDVPVVYFFEGIEGADQAAEESGDAEAIKFAVLVQSLPEDVRKQVQATLHALSNHLDPEDP